MTNEMIVKRAQALGITVEEMKAKVANLLQSVKNTNKPKSQRISGDALYKRSMVKAVERLAELGEDRYEITVVDVVEHERQMECGMVTVCAHKRAVVTLKK